MTPEGMGRLILDPKGRGAGGTLHWTERRGKSGEGVEAVVRVSWECSATGEGLRTQPGDPHPHFLSPDCSSHRAAILIFIIKIGPF